MKPFGQLRRPFKSVVVALQHGQHCSVLSHLLEEIAAPKIGHSQEQGFGQSWVDANSVALTYFFSFSFGLGIGSYPNH